MKPQHLTFPINLIFLSHPISLHLSYEGQSFAVSESFFSNSLDVPLNSHIDRGGADLDIS